MAGVALAAASTGGIVYSTGVVRAIRLELRLQWLLRVPSNFAMSLAVRCSKLLHHISPVYLSAQCRPFQNDGQNQHLPCSENFTGPHF